MKLLLELKKNIFGNVRKVIVGQLVPTKEPTEKVAVLIVQDI